jgi:hypothetical protein
VAKKRRKRSTPRTAVSRRGSRDVVELLTQILKVQAIQASSSKSVTDGARLLKLAGLDNQTIAEVLNTSAGTVRALTSRRPGFRTGRGPGRLA